MVTRSEAATDPQKKILTDRLLKALKPAQPRQRYVIWDATVPGFGVRVTDRPDAKGRAASISFIVMRRLPGQRQPIRHTIGRYHPDHPEALPLAKARDEARRVLGVILGGTSPKEEERRREDVERCRQEEQQRREREEAERFANTVGAVAEEFIKDMKRRGLRNAGEFEAIIRREILPKWRDRPISEITRKDAAKLIRDIVNRSGEIEPSRRRRMSGGPWAAHHAFSIAKTMFGWALDQDEIGLAASPFDSLKPKKLIGPKEPRQRTLDESEIRVVWKAAERFGGPYGDLVRLLVLTGQRLSPTATMQRADPDLDKALWNSPAAKMKMKKPHVTPLAPAAADVLRERLGQRIHRNGYLFSTTHGERPISGFSKFKRRLERLIEEIRGEEAGSTEIEPMPSWTLHDLRQTVRTKLPELGVSDVVAEAVLAHARPGVKGVYDLYTYLPEKRDALERWAVRVAAIVNPAPTNVIPLRGAAR